jgi:hypothetical protein
MGGQIRSVGSLQALSAIQTSVGLSSFRQVGMDGCWAWARGALGDGLGDDFLDVHDHILAS